MLIQAIKKFFKDYIFGVLIIVFVASISFGPRIINGFTPVEVLKNRCLEESKYKYRVGAICRDGWRSGATGRGACSHHGGVKEWIYKEVYRKTEKECLRYAKERSWIE